MQPDYAYDIPEALRPKVWPNLIKVAAAPYMGLTAYVGNNPYLVIGFDGTLYELEGESGDRIHLARFIWDDALINEPNMMVAATRIASSPLTLGCVFNGTEIGKLGFSRTTGEWYVNDGEGPNPVSLQKLIADLESAGWQVEEAQQEEVHEAASAMGEGEVPAKVEAPFCPACHGHTLTKLEELTEGDHEYNGRFRCKSCGHEFSHGKKKKAESSYIDTNGDNLVEGKWYTMLSPKYKVPDTVRLLRISPEEIQASASNEDNAVPITLTSADIDEEGYSFEPFIVEPKNAVFEAHIAQVLGRRSFSPSQQKDLIDEPGIARNASKLNLDGTHYAVESEDDDDSIFFLWG